VGLGEGKEPEKLKTSTKTDLMPDMSTFAALLAIANHCYPWDSKVDLFE